MTQNAQADDVANVIRMMITDSGNLTAPQLADAVIEYVLDEMRDLKCKRGRRV